MDELELAHAAIFSLEQAARRIRALADEANAPELADRLRALAGAVDGHARDLAAQPPTAS